MTDTDKIWIEIEIKILRLRFKTQMTVRQYIGNKIQTTTTVTARYRQHMLQDMRTDDKYYDCEAQSCIQRMHNTKLHDCDSRSTPDEYIYIIEPSSRLPGSDNGIHLPWAASLFN